MNIRKIKFQPKKPDEISRLVAWESDYGQEVEQVVKDIIGSVRHMGDKALVDYTEKLDRHLVNDVKQLRVSQEQLVEAWESIGDEVRKALQLAKNRISEYAERQKITNWQLTEADGSIMGQKITPLDSVGLYVPGGQAAYPSSVLMNAIPAKVAGVSRLVMTSPAMDGELNQYVLAAAFLCEVDEYYTIGGAQAIAALAYGTESISPVDKIVGPGNIFVATAKRQVFGQVDIDMMAGPSEIAIIGDGSAPAKWAAADLFSQAEHDVNAQAILITTSEAYANEVVEAMRSMLNDMPRREIIEQSMTERGAVILVDDIEQAVAVVDLIAPEHLEILTENAMDIAQRVKHAGAIFVGPYSCEALGDYVAGPNHVLPTSGTARFSSPLGVYDFQKRSSLIYCTADKASELAKSAKRLAETEGLPAHALSAQLRIQFES
ncbi:histidinol dehydrogenase [Ostreibacterium oceani]|uniref:Histidinol dehydrogenase n=1 Tax=Ostreibacterium oceani TaxID=2654998 RepID=A0A6N7EW17_9GAMM|nr:histidinol dehydrogenase [Ostreibacterium oceani]